MGVIRKTASVGTLGLVNFRSKKEKLRRAEFARDAEHRAREIAESGFARAESELKRLSKSEAKAAKKLAKLRKNRKVRKADRLATLLDAAQPVVKSGMETTRHTMHDVAKKSRKHGRRARKATREAAEHASHEMRRGAERVAAEARSVMSSN